MVLIPHRGRTSFQIRNITIIIRNNQCTFKLTGISRIDTEIPTCQIGIEQSQNLVKNILEYIKANNIPEERLPSVYVSGCQNSCGRHQAGDIGFAGGKKRVEDKIEDVFDVYAGGIVSREKTVLGTRFGTMLMSQIPEFIGKLSMELEKNNMNYREYINKKNNCFVELIKQYLV